MNLFANILLSALLFGLINSLVDVYQRVPEPWWTNGGRIVFVAVTSLVLGYISPWRRRK